MERTPDARRHEDRRGRLPDQCADAGRNPDTGHPVRCVRRLTPYRAALLEQFISSGHFRLRISWRSVAHPPPVSLQVRKRQFRRAVVGVRFPAPPFEGCEQGSVAFWHTAYISRRKTWAAAMGGTAEARRRVNRFRSLCSLSGRIAQTRFRTVGSPRAGGAMAPQDARGPV